MTQVENGITLSKKRAVNKGKGSYILLIKLPAEEIITVGGLKAIRFSPGYYAYVGSAMNGLEARVNRHLRQNKKIHWHIDYLLQRVAISSIILSETTDRTECAVAGALNRQFEAVSRFGSSDCRCRSHLFFSAGEMKPAIMAILSSLGMRPSLTKAAR